MGVDDEVLIRGVFEQPDISRDNRRIRQRRNTLSEIVPRGFGHRLAGRAGVGIGVKRCVAHARGDFQPAADIR